MVIEVTSDITLRQSCTKVEHYLLIPYEQQQIFITIMQTNNNYVLFHNMLNNTCFLVSKCCSKPYSIEVSLEKCIAWRMRKIDPRVLRVFEEIFVFNFILARRIIVLVVFPQTLLKLIYLFLSRYCVYSDSWMSSIPN